MEDPLQMDPEVGQGESPEPPALKTSNEALVEPVELDSRNEPEHRSLGERILFEYSNWGCLAYLGLLTLVLLATLVQALFMLVGWSDEPRSPLYLWIIPGVLMLTLLIMIGWSRIRGHF
jgi:hypothetical protein